VIKVVLTLALAFSLMTVVYSAQEAYAVPDCTLPEKPNLKSNELYLADTSGKLFKVDSVDASSCEVGLMGVECTDISIHPTTGVLYCITAAGELFTIDRTTPSTKVDLGDLTDPATGNPITTLNSFDFKPNGQAFVAGTECRLFEITDYTTVNSLVLALKFLMTTAAHPTSTGNDCIDAAGDLVYDITAGDKFYMSSTKCEEADGPGANVCTPNNGMYSLLLGPQTTTWIAELPEDQVHGADFVGSTTIISWATQNFEFFKTDTSGTQMGATITGTGIAVFGGTATPILLGGTAFMIDKTSLLLGAVQLNAGWITPVVFAGLALVIYKISRKK